MTTKATKNAKGGGTIRKRSDGRWEARYTLGIDPKTGKQIQKSVYGKTQKEVRQKLTAITAEIDDGTYMDIPRLKTADWLNTWVTEYIGNVKSSTRKSYQDHVRLNIIPYIGNVPLSKVTAAMIQQMYNELQTEKELSPKTIKNVHGVLHRALEQAQKMGYIRSDPLAAVTLPRIEKKQIKPLEDEELCAFLKEIRGSPYELVYFVTVFTGLRQGEVLGLTWDCVNFEKQTLLINKQHGKKKGTREYCFSSLKNDRPRVIEAAEGVMDALKKQQLRQQRWAVRLKDGWDNPDSLVFTTETGRYSFDKNQRQQLSELLSPEHASMWTSVLYGISSGLTDSDEMLVVVALSQVGNVGGEPYWSWYGYSHRVEWCACFVSWCFDQCGYRR